MKKHITLMLIVALSGYIYGMKSQSMKLYPYYQTKYVTQIIKDMVSITNKEQVDISSLKGRTITILTFGQSNAANFGETKYESKHNVFNLYYLNGKLYKSIDPLLGADGEGGSVWSRMGDKLIEQGLCDNVIFIPIGIGGSTISRWDNDGDLYDRVAKAINASQGAGLSIDYIFWHQGESEIDIQTTKETYKNSFMNILNNIRGNNVSAPVYIALATEKESLGGKEIYQAQTELIDGNNVRLGPKVYQDINNIKDRYQYIHFSDSGLNKLADLWIQSIKLTNQTVSQDKF